MNRETVDVHVERRRHRADAGEMKPVAVQVQHQRIGIEQWRQALRKENLVTDLELLIDALTTHPCKFGYIRGPGLENADKNTAGLLGERIGRTAHIVGDVHDIVKGIPDAELAK